MQHGASAKGYQMTAQNRPTIKARLADTPESWDAIGILATWRKTREMSRHLPRAIRTYAALLRGDLSVLEEYFPYLTSALSAGRHTPPIRRDRPAVTIAITEKDDRDNVADLLDSLGI